MKKTRHLFLESKDIVGVIPSEIGYLTNLTYLHLNTYYREHPNRLTGEIPPEIGNLTKLEHLHLYGNQLGCYEYDYTCDPNGASSACCITHCDDTDKCSGIIPSEIGNLTSLLTLRLENNQLRGEIPPEIGNLTNVWDLRLSSNQLTGEIPIEICSLRDSSPLLNNNQLCPPYPECLVNQEPFTDLNENGIWDEGEPFEDTNNNGIYEKHYVGEQDTSNCP